MLDDVDHMSVLIPRGCGHGTQSLTDPADVCYRIDREHDPAEAQPSPSTIRPSPSPGRNRQRS